MSERRKLWIIEYREVHDEDGRKLNAPWMPPEDMQEVHFSLEKARQRQRSLNRVMRKNGFIYRVAEYRRVRP